MQKWRMITMVKGCCSALLSFARTRFSIVLVNSDRFSQKNYSTFQYDFS